MAIQRSGRFGRLKKPLKSDMNVVPYIDVMLVLLVIFMVTAPMITSGIKVDLPEANSNPIVSDAAPAMVSLKEDGSYYLEYKQIKQSVTLDELKDLLTTAQQEADNQQLNIVINGDKTRPYGDVMGLMSTLQDAGLTQVGLLTKPVN